MRGRGEETYIAIQVYIGRIDCGVRDVSYENPPAPELLMTYGEEPDECEADEVRDQEYSASSVSTSSSASLDQGSNY